MEGSQGGRGGRGGEAFRTHASVGRQHESQTIDQIKMLMLQP